jgi:Zn-dependent protease/RNA polymerase subunit RPABC4/transcription elongation factor Spt4
MPTGRSGSIKLFRLHGIEVFLHWSWFLVAVYMIKSQAGEYSSISWNVLEYLALFLIVLTHEFGHALACRSVGGTADRIVLWPLGGVAYVDPPLRPGATLWSIVAGPLVNVALIPVLWGLTSAALSAGWAETMPNAMHLLANIFFINKWLLIFNILPIFPLDGGQILRSLLWFVLGRGRSLLVATVLGFLGAAAFIFFAYKVGSTWLIIMAVFMVWNCWAGLKHALALLKMAKIPRRENFSCPTCNSSPPMGAYWRCGNCKNAFDTFASEAACPHCAAQYPETRCFDCGRAHPMNQWTKHIVVSNPSELISRTTS